MSQISCGDVTCGGVNGSVVRVNHVDFELRDDLGKPARIVDSDKRHRRVEFASNVGKLVRHLKIKHRHGITSAAQFVGKRQRESFAAADCHCENAH